MTQREGSTLLGKLQNMPVTDAEWVTLGTKKINKNALRQDLKPLADKTFFREFATAWKAGGFNALLGSMDQRDEDYYSHIVDLGLEWLKPSSVFLLFVVWKSVCAQLVSKQWRIKIGIKNLGLLSGYGGECTRLIGWLVEQDAFVILDQEHLVHTQQVAAICQEYLKNHQSAIILEL